MLSFWNSESDFSDCNFPNNLWKMRQRNHSDHHWERGTYELPPPPWRITNWWRVLLLLHDVHTTPLLRSHPKAAKNDELHWATVSALHHQHLNHLVKNSISNQHVSSLQQPLLLLAHTTGLCFWGSRHCKHGSFPLAGLVLALCRSTRQEGSADPLSFRNVSCISISAALLQWWGHASRRNTVLTGLRMRLGQHRAEIWALYASAMKPTLINSHIPEILLHSSNGHNWNPCIFGKFKARQTLYRLGSSSSFSQVLHSLYIQKLLRL